MQNNMHSMQLDEWLHEWNEWYDSSGARCILTNDHRSSSLLLFYFCIHIFLLRSLAVVHHKYVSNTNFDEFRILFAYARCEVLEFIALFVFFFFIHLWRQISNSTYYLNECGTQLALNWEGGGGRKTKCESRWKIKTIRCDIIKTAFVLSKRQMQSERTLTWCKVTERNIKTAQKKEREKKLMASLI